MIDLVLSMLLLFIAFPIIVVLAMAIKLDSPGPAMYRDKRVGRKGKLFIIYKLRTMKVDAPDWRNPDGSCFNSPDDPRLTRVGKFVREMSLDELLELFSVIKGDMSLVGPRPDKEDQTQYYSEKEKRKLLVKPGITGWAQIHGRNSIPWKKRIEMDLDYINQHNVLLDIQILLRTFLYVLEKKDIYVKSKL